MTTYTIETRELGSGLIERENEVERDEVESMLPWLLKRCEWFKVTQEVGHA